MIGTLTRIAFAVIAPWAPPQNTAATTTAPDSCTMPAGWEEVAHSKPRFVVFGELHGTREAPAFVGRVACALAARGGTILVAVEHNAKQNAAFQHAWQQPHPKFAAALRKAGWAGRNDGVGSEAMLDMLVRLHALKASGRSIDMVAFNGPRDDAQAAKFRDLPGQGGHEAAQAENIRLAAGARAYDHVLVLVATSTPANAPRTAAAWRSSLWRCASARRTGSCPSTCGFRAERCGPVNWRRGSYSSPANPCRTRRSSAPAIRSAINPICRGRPSCPCRHLRGRTRRMAMTASSGSAGSPDRHLRCRTGERRPALTSCR